MVGQDLEVRADGVFAIARRVAPDRVISTVDPEARHGHETSAHGFDGYKAHIAIDPDSEIITATAVTAANAPDGSVAEELLEDILPHAWAIQELSAMLFAAVGTRARVRVQLPLALSDDSLPEPDLAVVAPGSYREGHPTSALLVVEVADSSIRKDRHIKGRLYASARIPEYWIVNLVEGVVEVHSQPSANGYLAEERHARGTTLRLRAFPDIEVRVADVLP